MNLELNLWDYLIGLQEHNSEFETTFKSKDPKRYIQVKTSVINEGTQLLAVCTDITRIMKLEKEGQVMRAHFFSSIAHELRTPLNTIIPMLKIVL